MGGAIELAGVSKSFAGVQALRAITFDVEPDAVVGILGPNGSGKTTLLNVISGLTRPSRRPAELRLDRLLVSRTAVQGWHRANLPGHPALVFPLGRRECRSGNRWRVPSSQPPGGARRPPTPRALEPRLHDLAHGGTMTRAPEIAVRSLFASWEAIDLEMRLALFSPDATYEDPSLAPLKGLEQMRDALAPEFGKLAEVHINVRSVLSDDMVAFAEAGFRGRLRDGREMEFPFVVLVELEGEKIARFAEYFDTRRWPSDYGS